MLGTIAGDIIGSAYEKANYRAKDFAPLFHPRARFTDDTVCTVAIADSLLNGTPPAVALQTWGRRYEHIGGWGQRLRSGWPTMTRSLTGPGAMAAPCA